MAIPHVNPTEPRYTHKVTNEGQSSSQEVDTETYKMIPNKTTTKGSDRIKNWSDKIKVKIKRQKVKLLSSYAYIGGRKIMPNETAAEGIIKTRKWSKRNKVKIKIRKVKLLSSYPHMGDKNMMN